MKGILIVSLFGFFILQMSDFQTKVNGVRYMCKSDGTALAGESVGDLGQVLVLRGFIEVNGKGTF
jgi:hypothetical protein